MYKNLTENILNEFYYKISFPKLTANLSKIKVMNSLLFTLTDILVMFKVSAAYYLKMIKFTIKKILIY